MTVSTLLQTYMAEGAHSARPATPAVGTNGIAIYYETDTGNTFLYDSTGAAWVQLTSGGGGFPAAGPIKNYLGGNVNVVTGSFTDGPVVAQGATGTWFASGSIVLEDVTNAQNAFNVRLWDGTTVISSGTCNILSSAQQVQISLSGYLATPAGNLRISVEAANHNSAFMAFNLSGDSKDCGISAYRIL